MKAKMKGTEGRSRSLRNPLLNHQSANGLSRCSQPVVAEETWQEGRLERRRSGGGGGGTFDETKWSQRKSGMMTELWMTPRPE